jgi:signal transduction histidine kinase
VGSSDGLVIIDPTKYKEDNRSLRVYLNEVMVNYEPRPLKNSFRLPPESWERISRDLHDRLGAYAAAIKNNVVRIERSDKNITDQLQQLKENAEEMVMALRETIWALQLTGVNLINLSDRFKSLVNRMAANYPDINIIFKEEILLDKELSPNEGIQLMRIMQEALTNALKHAGPSTIIVHIHGGKRMEITISDNGMGFDMEHVVHGQGLENMRQRALEAGFDFSISSNDSGTVVSISMN